MGRWLLGGAVVARVRLDNYAVVDAPRLGVRGWLRWVWRQVTSMRVAIILLLLLALGAIPGSVLPQWPREPARAREFLADNPTLGQWCERLGLLDVYGSAWFTAIYVLLFASLIGCIIPRAMAHFRALRAPVSAAPTALGRYEHAESAPVPQGARTFMTAAARFLRPQPGWWGAVRGYRVRIDERAPRGDDAETELALSADNGHMRELGNLIFHTALVGVLVAVAAGSLLTYRGQAIIVEGRSFTNAVAAYDTFTSGRLFNPDRLYPFTLRLDRFEAVFSPSARPQSFTAFVTLTEPDSDPRATDIRVNKPLGVGGANLYLQGNGFAPDLTVTDADGNVAFAGPVVFLPQNGAYTSTGVVKVPDVTSGPQLGLKATLYPTAVGAGTNLSSVHPDPTNPVMVFTAYQGDLGLDDGVPQNVYRLDESQLSPVRGVDGDPAVLTLTPGATVDLPDGLGSVTWNSLPRFAAIDIRADPSLPWLLSFAILVVVGLALSLFSQRRRIWLVAPLNPRAGHATTVVVGAAYAPPHDVGVGDHLRRVMAAATGTLTRSEDR